VRAEALAGLGRRTEAVRAYAAAMSSADELEAEDLQARTRALLDAMDENELRALTNACFRCPEGGYARLRLARILAEEGRLEEAASAAAAVEMDFFGDPLGQEAGRLRAEWESARAAQPGVIGLLLPLSGPLQPFGARALRGALMASELFAASADPGIAFAVADSRGEPDAAAQGVRDLVARGVLAIVGPLKGAAAVAAASVARELGVPLIAPTAAPEAAGCDTFRLYLREEDEVAGLVEYAARTKGLRRFAILYPETELGRRYRDLFWDAVVAQGGEITGVEGFPPSAGDQEEAILKLTGVFALTPGEIRERFVAEERTRLLRERELLVALGLAEGGDEAPQVPVDAERLAKYKPPPVVDFDAVFLPVSSVEAAQIAPQFPFHDVEKVTLLGIRTWNYPALVQVGDEYVAGALFAAEFHPALPGARAFADQYRRAYGEDPGVIDAYAYDAVHLLTRIVATPGGDARATIARRLASLWAAPGVTGPFTTHPNDDIAASPKLLTVRNGRIEPVEGPQGLP
jgi:ABC-type branched-subunit amino acid transport system substrate-binding protein